MAAALRDRRLLVDADEATAAERDAAALGGRLLASLIEQCYPGSGQHAEVEFEDARAAARIGAALAFGAVTARVLAPDQERPDSVDLLAAVFNLGIGLVDSLCDEDPETGIALLELLHGDDLVSAAAEPRRRGWLGAGVPRSLAEDYTGAFTVDIVETFFDTLHLAYPGGAWSGYRRHLGKQLAAALEAERRTVTRAAEEMAFEELVECSRLTSVLPFEVLATVARGDSEPAGHAAATSLGEAMWRIDDLVDLGEDARTGALNAVLLAATGEPAPDPVGALERLLASDDIARAAAEAASSLNAALEPVAESGAGRTFRYFTQRYARIEPSEPVEAAAPSDSAASIDSSSS